MSCPEMAYTSIQDDESTAVCDTVPDRTPSCSGRDGIYGAAVLAISLTVRVKSVRNMGTFVFDRQMRS